MATSTKAFLIELYEEYLEEASFLYEQRLGLLKDPEVSWKRIGEFEERFEAHIDGLVVGGDLALEVCTRQALEGDFGELQAALRVFCRQNRKDFLLRILHEFDADDPQKIRAVGDALKQEMPESWEADLFRLSSEGGEKFVPILANVTGYRRLKFAGDLCSRLIATSTKPLATMSWAAGRLREKGTRDALMKQLQGEDESVASAAALALLRLGEQLAVSCCLQRAQNWCWLPIGLGGDRTVLNQMIERAKANQLSGHGLIALGLLGGTAGVPVLIRSLANPDAAESAAMGLQAITGAGLSETVFVPDKIEEDELFENERESFKRGQPPLRPDGKPYGTNVTRLTQNPKDWEKWWAQNGSRFNPNARHRYGKPYSPAALLETLRSETSPHLLRQLAYEEFVVRYGYDFVFETDMRVKEQEAALLKCADWVKANNGRFTEGEWYFAGRVAS